MLRVIGQADKFARSMAPVLITGASGTGKELLARHIHCNSNRATGPFVAVNCAAIPEHLVEAEMFGFERGAFSGAIATRPGWLEAAQGGTILLDEIGEMDHGLQSKLLRVLQEREIARIGSRRTIRLDVRIIATTNRDIEREVRLRRFRDDLFYRLNVANLHIPALRDRPGDILPLAEHFLRKVAQQNARRVDRLADDACQALSDFAWPGNVRQLENSIHRAVLVTNAATIEADDLGLPEVPKDFSFRQTTGHADIVRSMEEIERDAIMRAVRATNGNKTRAAAALGVSVRSLRSKVADMERLGMPCLGRTF